ncbi:hypothetical protein A4R44_00818 [Amycolatopsis sp. M39]|nr:hypothetical protein A4R44_00818 [Amycolatopsis sp. M39]
MTDRDARPTGHAHHPTTRKGSDCDHSRQQSHDEHLTSTGWVPRSTHRECRPRTPGQERQGVAAPQPRPETYDEQRARLDAEAVDRWAVIVADWEPMTDKQIRAFAVILNRIDTRLTGQ